MTWNYDPASDVLYLSIGEPQPALSVDIGDGLLLRYDEGKSAIVGITILNLKSRLTKMQPTLTDRTASSLHRSPFDLHINPVETMSNTINQYGQGDNIAGDKVLGDKIAGDKILGDRIQTQINNNPDLAQAARDIKALLNELSDEYNPTTEKGQAKIQTSALTQIKQNPQLKQRTLKALKSAGEEALEQAISHPVAKVVVQGIKGFIEG